MWFGIKYVLQTLPTIQKNSLGFVLDWVKLNPVFPADCIHVVASPYSEMSLFSAALHLVCLNPHVLFLLCGTGDALQIQCYQCEEMNQNDCSTPEYIVNCTVNVQDMCQKEVLVKPDGKMAS